MVPFVLDPAFDFLCTGQASEDHRLELCHDNLLTRLAEVSGKRGEERLRVLLNETSELTELVSSVGKGERR